MERATGAVVDQEASVLDSDEDGGEARRPRDSDEDGGDPRRPSDSEEYLPDATRSVGPEAGDTYPGPGEMPDTTRPLLDLRPGDPAQIGAYTLLRRIPGFHVSDVFLVRSARGNLLVLKLSGSSELADPERISREASYLSRVRSSRVAKVVDSGVWNDRAYFVQEFIDGPTLADLLKSDDHTATSLPDAYRLGRGLAEALRDVHRADVVHRDIKPSNIILNPTKGVVLVDFGIARTEQDARITRTGAMLGTPRYMSPEQASGATVGEASDVFQWGLVVGEALLGNHPIIGIDYDGLQAVHRCDTDPALEGNLGRLVKDTLQVNPGHRPSVGQILAELDRTDVLPGPQTTTAIPVPERRLTDLRNLHDAREYLAPRVDEALAALVDKPVILIAAIAAAALVGWLLGFLLGAVLGSPWGGA